MFHITIDIWTHDEDRAKKELRAIALLIAQRFNDRLEIVDPKMATPEEMADWALESCVTRQHATTDYEEAFDAGVMYKLREEERIPSHNFDKLAVAHNVTLPESWDKMTYREKRDWFHDKI